MASHRLEYERRVNRVIDTIRAHLAEELTLERLSAVAAFSPFHFHRVFKSITGETLFEFIQRLRLEQAARRLSLNRDCSVLEVALQFGFASAATFARAFKARFGMSATAWRAQQHSHRNQNRKSGKTFSKPGKAGVGRAADTASMKMKIANLPACRVAYMRYVGAYGAGGAGDAGGIPQLWERFHRWLDARDEFNAADRITLGVAYDSPSVSAPEHCRYDACVIVDADFPGERRVNVMDLPGGKYAVQEFHGRPEDITGVWESAFRNWLPDSGYQPDDRPCIELYRGVAVVDPRTGTFRCEFYLPVKPL